MGEDICKQYIQKKVNVSNIQRIHTAQHKKKKKTDLKMGRRSEETFFQSK